MESPRTYVVTGAGRGLGAAYVRRLTASGGQVVGVDRSWTDAPPPGCTALTLDVCESSAAEQIVAAALDNYGGLDALVNNAGAVAPGPLTEVTDTDWDRLLEVNLTASFRLVRAVARLWAAAKPLGAFRVVNTTSGAGLHGAPNHAAYVAAKAAVAGLTVAAARELKPLARVNAVAPIALTDLIPRGSALAEAMRHPRAGGAWEADDVAPFVAYLASAECGFTGGVFGVHGDCVTEYVGWQGAREFEAPSGGWTAADLSEAFSDYRPVRPARTQLELLNK